MTPKHRSFNS